MNRPTVLLVDDEPDILQLLEITLARMNLSTLRATTLAEARAHLETRTPDLCLTDMKLPDGNGLTLIEFMQQICPEVPVAMITAHGSVESAIEALKLGAFDFVTKPLALDKLRELVKQALQLQIPATADTSREMIGQAPPMVRLRAQAHKVARSQAPVHIQGESGVGKEVIARLIHQLSPRAAKPFIAVNCGAIPPDLVESELFGHRKGAFTGAQHDKAGLFQAASGGTLLLDEVADLPLAVQVKLLRVIQEKAVRPVGAENEVPTDVRLLSATHKNLNHEVREGRFRDDLYYRINVIGIHVPSLRERQEDIPELADHLLRRMANEHQTKAKHLDAQAVKTLIAHDFPGNVRELENVLARANALCEGSTISSHDLHFEAFIGAAKQPLATPATPSTVADLSKPLSQSYLARAETSANDTSPGLAEVKGDLEVYLEDIERSILNDAMLKHRWNKTAAAKALGISFRSLRYRLKKLGLDD